MLALLEDFAVFGITARQGPPRDASGNVVLLFERVPDVATRLQGSLHAETCLEAGERLEREQQGSASSVQIDRTLHGVSMLCLDLFLLHVMGFGCSNVFRRVIATPGQVSRDILWETCARIRLLSKSSPREEQHRPVYALLSLGACRHKCIWKEGGVRGGKSAVNRTGGGSMLLTSQLPDAYCMASMQVYPSCSPTPSSQRVL